MYTKGKWQKEKRLTGEWAIFAGDDLEDYIGAIGRHFNANLICSAVNACISINPEHPEEVAEGMGDIVKHYKELLQTLKRVAPGLYEIGAEEKEQALAKIGGK